MLVVCYSPFLVRQAAEDVLGSTKRKHRDWFDENDTAALELLYWLHQVHMIMNDKSSTSKKDTYRHVKQTAQATLRRMKDRGGWTEQQIVRLRPIGMM